MAFAHAGLPLRWEGKASTLSETGVVAEGELKGCTVLRINPKYFRRTEVRLPHPAMSTCSQQGIWRVPAGRAGLKETNCCSRQDIARVWFAEVSQHLLH